jgi:hypothetical protein
VWPVLFWLPNPARENRLHSQLITLEVPVPLATATRHHSDRDHFDAASPAGPVWMIPGRLWHRVHLADIPDTLSAWRRSEP